MPIYEYSCRDCGLVFEMFASMSQKQSGLNPQCPQCGSMETQQAFRSLTFVRGGNGSDPRPPSCGPGCGC